MAKILQSRRRPLLLGKQKALSRRFQPGEVGAISVIKHDPSNEPSFQALPSSRYEQMAALVLCPRYFHTFAIGRHSSIELGPASPQHLFY